MKDSEARGLILQRLYEIRHSVPHANLRELGDLSFDPNTLGNVLEQLAQQNLITWKPLRSHQGYVAFMARITAFGVDVIEGTAQPPISIAVDNSVHVSGSQNVMVGGQGNVQAVTMDFEKLVSIVDSSGASVLEREEAKSLLKKIAENKLVQAAFGGWIKSTFGG